MARIILPEGFDLRRMVRGSDPYTSLLAAQQASKASAVAIEQVAICMLDGRPRIDEEIWLDCRENGFLRTFSTIRHARLALSEAEYLVETGVERATSNGSMSREWVWYGAAELPPDFFSEGKDGYWEDELEDLLEKLGVEEEPDDA